MDMEQFKGKIKYIFEALQTVQKRQENIQVWVVIWTWVLQSDGQVANH